MKISIQSMGGRKLGLTVIVFLSTVLLLTLEKLTKTDYASVVAVILSSYIGGTVLQSFFVPKEGVVTPDKIFEALGGRMFALVVFIFIVTAVLVFFKYIAAETYTDIVKWIAILYTSGNVTDKIAATGLPFSIVKK